MNCQSAESNKSTKHTFTDTHTNTHSLPLFSLILTSKGILISLPPTALPLRTGGKEAIPTYVHTYSHAQCSAKSDGNAVKWAGVRHVTVM